MEWFSWSWIANELCGYDFRVLNLLRACYMCSYDPLYFGPLVLGGGRYKIVYGFVRNRKFSEITITSCCRVRTKNMTSRLAIGFRCPSAVWTGFTVLNSDGRRQ